MLLLGDILLSPFKGLLAIFEKINEAVQQEQKDNRQEIMLSLRDLYGLLESGKLSEEDFLKKETDLLNKLDELDELDKFDGGN